MVIFDASILLFIFSNNVGVPRGRSTKAAIDRPIERVEFLIKKLERAKTKIIIPTPALAELLVRSGSAAAAQLRIIEDSANFRLAPFDARAAVVVASLSAERGDRPTDDATTFAKVKYDRQIAAIAKVEGATAIYTDDDNVKHYAKRLMITVVTLEELPLPPAPKPKTLDLFRRPDDGAGLAMAAASAMTTVSGPPGEGDLPAGEPAPDVPSPS